MENYKVDTIKLKKIMIEQDLGKIVDLSAASGVDRNTLSRVLSGEAKPSTTVIEKLMTALHIPPERAGLIFLRKTYGLRKIMQEDGEKSKEGGR